MKTCICIKGVKSSTGHRFEPNHRYKFELREYLFYSGMCFLVYIGDKYPVRFSVSDFRDNFIDLQTYRQNILNQLIN